MDEINLKPAKTQDEVVEIDLLELLEVWRQHILLILLVTALGATFGYAYSRFYLTPVYTASSTMYIVSASSNSMLDLTDLNLGTNLAKDYVELVQSRTMLERVLEASGDQLTTTQLRNMLSVSNVANTRIIRFQVTSRDPEQAMRLANACVDQAVKFLPRIMNLRDNPPSLIDAAIQPTVPSNIHLMQNIAIGAMIGFVLAAGIYTLLYMLNDTFDSADDVETYIGIAPLAMVPENGQKYKGGEEYYYSYYSDKHLRSASKKLRLPMEGKKEAKPEAKKETKADVKVETKADANAEGKKEQQI